MGTKALGYDKQNNNLHFGHDNGPNPLLLPAKCFTICQSPEHALSVTPKWHGGQLCVTP